MFLRCSRKYTRPDWSAKFKCCKSKPKVLVSSFIPRLDQTKRVLHVALRLLKKNPGKFSEARCNSPRVLVLTTAQKKKKKRREGWLMKAGLRWMVNDCWSDWPWPSRKAFSHHCAGSQAPVLWLTHSGSNICWAEHFVFWKGRSTQEGGVSEGPRKHVYFWDSMYV